MTFSSAVMLWNSRMFWNVRAMPRFVILKRLTPLILSPVKRTSPSVGW